MKYSWTFLLCLFHLNLTSKKPTLSVSDPVGTFEEDDEDNIPLTIFVGQSKDTDDSELLRVEITLPQYDNGTTQVPIGTLLANGTVPTVTMTNGTTSGVYVITSSSTNATANREQINAFLSLLELDPALNYAGQANINVTVSSIEQDSDENQVFTRNETVTDQIVIIVAPVADTINITTVQFQAEANGLEGKYTAVAVH